MKEFVWYMICLALLVGGISFFVFVISPNCAAF